MTGPGDGFVEGIGDPPTGGVDSAAIAAAVREPSGPARMGGSQLAGHDAADRFSTRGPVATGRYSTLTSRAIADGAYLRAMLGNLYFAIPALGLVLGLFAGVQTGGLAVPPSTVLTLTILALGAFDAFAGLAALTGFAIVTLCTGNLISTHMINAAPGEQTLVYTLTGLFGLGVLWFAGANVAQRLRPLEIHREGTPMMVWSRRIVDFAVIPVIGTFVIWLAAWQMPTLTGAAPQELFVTIQDHLLEVKIVAFVAILARVLLEAVAGHHFHVRTAATTSPAVPARRGAFAWVFWLVRAAFALIILWEFLAWGWMTWVAFALFVAVGIAAWAGRQFPRRSMGRHWLPISLLRILIVVVLAELVMSQLPKHLVNPTPMLGGLLIAIGVMLVVFAFVEQVVGSGRSRNWLSLALDVVAIALIVLLVWGNIGFTSTPFDNNRGVYVAPTGAVFVADTANNRVVLVENGGYRVTVASGLNQPADVVAEGGSQGYVYIADAGNNRVVRLAGYDNQSVGWESFNHFNTKTSHLPIVQTTVGTGLNDPQSVSVDGSGNLFIADTGNNRIVEINRKSGAQTTFLSGLTGPLAVMADPFYTKVVYVANTGAGTVLRILPNGKREVFLRQLNEPAGLAQDPWGNFYVAEEGSGQVMMLPFGGGLPKVIATGLGHPRGLSVDALGNVFVSDSSTGQVKVISSLRLQRIRTHGMPDPTAVAYAPSGAVYVTDGAQGWLQSWSNGALHTVATGLVSPVGVAAAGSLDRVWVDQANGQLDLVNPSTGFVRIVATALADPRQLWGLRDGSVLVALRGSGEIIRVSTSGQISRVLSGLAQPVGVAEDRFGDLAVGLTNGDVYSLPYGGKSEKLFNLLGITAMAFDAKGNLYAASSKFKTVVMHVATSGRDAVVNRNFRSLTGMSASPSGNLWIGDAKSLGLFEVVPGAFHVFLTQL